MNDAAQSYVRLVLAMGEHDADYVDSYYGPPAWREEARAAKQTLGEIHASAVALRETLERIDHAHEGIESLRLDYLRRQTDALIARAEMLQGRRFTFDEESEALYDAVAPTHGEDVFPRAQRGHRPGTERRAAHWRRAWKRFARSSPSRARSSMPCSPRPSTSAGRMTVAHMPLPDGESFVVEYVNGKSWSGYNWYQGGYRSLIQVNTDLPIFIDRAIDLACHEGYPGHHVYNTLLEQTLVRDRGWIGVLRLRALLARSR